MRTVTTTREYDAEGRLVKETVVDVTTPEPYTAPVPMPVWPPPVPTLPTLPCPVTSVTGVSGGEFVAVN